MNLRASASARFRSRPSLRVLLLGAGLLLVAAAPAPLSPLAVTTEIDAILQSAEAGTAFWGVYVQDVATGQVVYQRNADKALLPASNEKLITTATAVAALGSDFRYQTTLYFKGRVDGTVLRGDLIIRGSGDPTFASLEAGGSDPLRTWATGVAALGVTRIEGRIIGDDDVFDDRPYAEGWDVAYLTSQSGRSMGVSTSGLSYRDNVVEVTVTSDGAGRPPKITTVPEGYLAVENQAVTHRRNRGWVLDASRAYGAESVTVTGDLPHTFRGSLALPVVNPTLFTVHAFKQYLAGSGVDVSAATLVDVDDLEKAPEYEDATPLFVHASPPLADIMAILNKESNNFYAEQVFRTFAWGGAAEGAARRVKELLGKAGVNTTTVSVFDGSGLSRKNLVPPEAMGQLLTYMYRHPEREAFIHSMARGGERGSTLSGRLHQANVFAKTGSLEFVRSLSGYVSTSDGRTLAFAVFANNFTGSSYAVTHTIDRIVLTLAGVPAG